ncbi:hypothetical protein CDAR_374881 [Caerostris darwini]|uniref:Uncharacterized protein n=1 Tax=Caerostris darwini TaxID=1538125 RepID=A0AAV4RQN5_9ARAC|nr:hypothetical protein CDAR_374881 [Caerostris darwini]
MPPADTHGSDTPETLLTYGHCCVNGYLPWRSTSVPRLRPPPPPRAGGGGCGLLKRNKARLLPFNFRRFTQNCSFGSEPSRGELHPSHPTPPPVLLQESFHRLLRRLESPIKGS